MLSSLSARAVRGLTLISTAACLWLSGAASAQVFSQTLGEDAAFAIAGDYLWTLGDDPAFAGADLDESSWIRQPIGTFPGSWRGVGWLRFRVRVEPAGVGRVLGLRLEQEGAAEVFVDGALLHAFGIPSAEPARERADRTGDPRPVLFQEAREHVIAVRYSAHLLETPRWSGLSPLVVMSLGDLRAMHESRLRQVRLLTFHQMLLSGLFIAFALVHLMVFLFRPIAGPNLYCGLAATAGAATAFLNFSAFVQRDPGDYWLRFTAFQIAFLALAVAALRFVYSCVVRELPRPFWPFTAAAAALAAAALARPFLTVSLIFAYMLLVNFEMIRVVVSRPRERRIEGMWILGAGALPLAVLSPYQLLAELEIVPALWSFLTFPSPYSGLAAIMFAMTVFLGLVFARTQGSLERELERVHRLSAEKLEQEKLARRQEIEKARLEAENARRAEELEQARQLQASLLPSRLPAFPGLEMAVHAATATEVGGDYYDFLEHRAGLTVVVGDASGHGAQAGTLVAATKGMLLTSEDLSPAACLDRISRGLREMRLRRRHMALAAARFERGGRRVIFSAAAMPPFLIYRQARREVVSLTLPSLPLGSFRGGGSEEKTLDLEPGDRVVLMSDGLPETLDEEIEPLGYERVEALVAERGRLSPRALLGALVEAGRQHAGGRSADDDVTILVVGIR
ncbi:MAG: PP2C family protein-serine/threonine phosphatase [Acidobacteriota bacterium]